MSHYLHRVSLVHFAHLPPTVALYQIQYQCFPQFLFSVEVYIRRLNLLCLTDVMFIYSVHIYVEREHNVLLPLCTVIQTLDERKKLKLQLNYFTSRM